MYTYTYISYRVLVEVRARAVSAGKRDVVRTNGRARTGPRKPAIGPYIRRRSILEEL